MGCVRTATKLLSCGNLVPNETSTSNCGNGWIARICLGYHILLYAIHALEDSPESHRYSQLSHQRPTAYTSWWSTDNQPTFMNSIFLADATDTAAFGIGGLIVFVPILLIWYSIMCLLVPIFIYRIMRNTTESYDRLCKIESLLKQQLLQQPTARSAEPAASTWYKGSLSDPDPDAAFVFPKASSGDQTTPDPDAFTRRLRDAAALNPEVKKGPLKS